LAKCKDRFEIPISSTNPAFRTIAAALRLSHRLNDTFRHATIS